MRLVIQRVSRAHVTVDNALVGAIEKGLLVLLAIHHNDSEKEVAYCVEKLINLRIFTDSAGKMNLSLLDISGELLIISQFTLYGDCANGRRPSFTESAPPEKAQKLYEFFIQESKKQIKHVACGIFGAHMQVSLINDGPVTLILDREGKQ